MNKTDLIRVRVTPTEKQYIRAKVEETGFNTISEYMLASSIKPFNLHKKKMNGMVYELNKIGINLNQAMKYYNLGRIDGNRLTNSIETIERELKDLLEIYKEYASKDF